MLTREAWSYVVSPYHDALNHMWLSPAGRTDISLWQASIEACDTQDNNMRVTVQSRRTPGDVCYLSQHGCVTGLDAIRVLSLVAAAAGCVHMPFTPCANGDGT